MAQRKSLNAIQESFQFWRQRFVHEVIEGCKIDLLSHTIERDACLFIWSLILVIARITDIEACVLSCL